MVKKLKWNLILMSLLYVGLGIFLVMKPGTALNIVCYALGGVVLACAAVQLIRYFVVERGVFQSQLTLISGLICLALGVFLLLRSDIVVSILPIVFGLFVIFDAIGRVQNALDLRRCGYDTNHSYFNLNGEGDILGQKLRIYASNYLEGNNQTCPTGAILPVANTPMDFTEGKLIGRDIDTGFAQTTMVGGGYDHCFVIDRARGSSQSICAWVTSEKTGISMNNSRASNVLNFPEISRSD